MIRQRTNISPTENVSFVNHVEDGPDANSVAYSIKPQNALRYYPTTLHNERIVDESQGVGNYNNCTHIKQHTEYNCNNNYFEVLHAGPTGPFELAIKGYANNPRNVYPDGAVLFRSSVGSLQANVDMKKWEVPNYSSLAVQTMWPEVESRLSLVNSIYELKDFKKLPRLLGQTARMLNRFNELAILAKSVMGSRFRKQTLKEVVNVTAGHHLNYKFNLAPLMSDIQAVRTAIHQTRQEIKSLLDHENQILVSHYRKLLTPDDIGLIVYPEADQVVEDGAYVSGMKRCLTASDILYTATMEYTYTYPDWIRKHAYVLGHLDALGVNLDPSIIWNGIRLSFLIDWVAKVSNFLTQFRLANFRASVSVHRFCHSVKYRTIATHNSYAFEDAVNAIPGPNDDRFIVRRLPGQILHQRVTDVYVRRKVTPDIVNALQLSGISKTEIALGSSLLASTLSRLR